MTDERHPPVISVKVAGRMRRLATAKHWRSAISNGELSRDTPVIIERANGQPAQLAAGDIEELLNLFDELVGPVATPPPPPARPSAPPPPTPPPVVSPWDEHAPPQTPPSIPEEAVADTFVEPDYSIDPSQSATTNGGNAPLLIIVGFLLLLTVGVFLFGRSGDASESSAVADTTTAVGNQFSMRFFASHNVPIRKSRSESAAESGRLSRGEQVFSTQPVDGWVEISKGGFVRLDELLTTAPPPIDQSTLDDYFTIEPVDVLTAPESGASSIASIDKMTRVSVLGTVNSDYAEIVTDTGKVGYVKWEHFGGIGGAGRTAWIAVDNRCDTIKNIAFSFIVNGARTSHNGYWTFPPGYHAVEYGDAAGQRIYVDSVFNFFADLGDDFHLRQDDVVTQELDDKARVNGRLIEMKRIVPELTSDGAYSITFC